MMKSNRLMICLVALLLVAGAGIAADDKGKGKQKDGELVGWVTDSHCGARGDNNPGHADCAKRCVEGRGAKYVLYTPSDKKIFTLEPQDKVADFAGKRVRVKGSVEGETLKVESIEATEEQKN